MLIKNGIILCWVILAYIDFSYNDTRAYLQTLAFKALLLNRNKTEDPPLLHEVIIYLRTAWFPSYDLRQRY